MSHWSAFQRFMAMLLLQAAVILIYLRTPSLIKNLLSSKLRHYLFDFSPAKFIFGLYMLLILGGTTVLCMSQAERFIWADFNIQGIFRDFFEDLHRLWSNGSLNYENLVNSVAILKDNLSDDGNWGMFNGPNFRIFVDTLFTATSAVCLTGMTTCDVTVYPETVIFTLILLGAGSLMSIALLFNIGSYFSTEASPQGAFSLHEYVQARKMGSFTLKVMYTAILLSSVCLTMYFLPPNSVNVFFREQADLLIKFFASAFVFVAILGISFLFVIFVLVWLYNNVDEFRNKVNAFFGSHIVYFTTITTVAVGWLIFLYSLGTVWEQKDFLWLVKNSILLAISAFTNAGFDTFNGDLVQRLGHYHANQVFTFIIMGTIVLGSLGMQVIREFPHMLYECGMGVANILHGNFAWRKISSRISLDSKLIVSFNLILWVGGGLLFFFLEQNNCLRSLNSFETFTSTAFQTINMRTAGFTTRVDVSEYSSATLLFVMTMMLIGGSPNSMSGGMKTTTVAVLLLSVKAWLLRERQVTAFGENIHTETIYKAMVTFLLELLGLMVALIIIFISYNGAESNYLRIAFDVVGAFTTIGLNTGISDWNNTCKLVLIVCMCFGKIGVLAIGMTMFNKRKRVKIKGKR